MRKKLVEYSRSQIEYIVDEWVIGKNAKRDREIFKLALLDGISQEQIAEMYGLSTRQVQNIIYKIQRKLYDHL